jgi:4-aminobutyrate aminotransferase-like enzyme
VYTGRPGVISFETGFHGQSYGALAVAGRRHFWQPFEPQLGPHTARAPFPYPFRRRDGVSEADDVARCLECVRERARELTRRGYPPGCVIVEPIQGREGEIVPSDGFLPGLRALCDELGLLLIADEIFTGCGRTGRMWACEHSGVVPDLLCAGKTLGGGFPISIVAGSAEVMEAWHPTTPEAPHASTFLGHPIGCAAALAVLRELRTRRLVERSREAGARLLAALLEATGHDERVGEVRGAGMMIGIELVRDRASREPFPELMPRVLQRGLERGLILLPGGAFGNVISLSPAFTSTDEQLAYVAEELPKCLGG